MFEACQISNICVLVVRFGDFLLLFYELSTAENLYINQLSLLLFGCNIQNKRFLLFPQSKPLHFVVNVCNDLYQIPAKPTIFHVPSIEPRYIWYILFGVKYVQRCITETTEEEFSPWKR